MGNDCVSPKEISDWLDGQCENDEAVRLDRHVAACSRCRKQYRLILWFRAFVGKESSVPDLKVK